MKQGRPGDWHIPAINCSTKCERLQPFSSIEIEQHALELTEEIIGTPAIKQAATTQVATGSLVHGNSLNYYQVFVRAFRRICVWLLQAPKIPGQARPSETPGGPERTVRPTKWRAAFSTA